MPTAPATITVVVDTEHDAEIPVTHNSESSKLLVEWLTSHGIDPMQVVANARLIRDPGARTITYTGFYLNDEGRKVLGPDHDGETVLLKVERTAHGPEDQQDPWPGPLPRLILEQPRQPEICPTCLRDLGSRA